MHDEHPGSGSKLRRWLPHDAPSWVPDGAVVFLTIAVTPRGPNHLCHEPLAEALWQSAVHRQELSAWWVHLWLLMPDHLHALVSFGPEPGLHATVRAWKRYTARQYGVPWQLDFFDHRLRGEAAVEEKADYIRQNPVRAGLVAEAADWPYVWPR
jgi:REP element-mobilizing transposase RayT